MQYLLIFGLGRNIKSVKGFLHNKQNLSVCQNFEHNTVQFQKLDNSMKVDCIQSLIDLQLTSFST